VYARSRCRPGDDQDDERDRCKSFDCDEQARGLEAPANGVTVME
jgi:hypothetical protein